MIESATWRCARWTAPRDVIVGYGRDLALSEVFFSADIAGAGLQALRHQKSVGRYAQRGVMVKPTPTSALIVAQTEILL